MTNIPYETVRRILRENVEEEVSSKSVELIQIFLSELLEYIAKASSIEINKLNSIRNKANLPELRRIQPNLYKSILLELFNSSSVVRYDGKVAHNSKDTILSKAN